MLVKKNKPTTHQAKRRRAVQAEVNKKKRGCRVLAPTKRQMTDLIRIKAERARRLCNQRVLFSQIGLSLALGIILILFNWNFRTDNGIVTLSDDQMADFEEIKNIPLTNQPPPPPPKIMAAPIIIEVPDEEILDEMEIEIDMEVTEDMIVEDVIFDNIPVEEEKAEEIFIAVETPPEPVGGFGAFYEFVGKHIKYPNQARRASVQGRVFVKFVVNKDGNLTDIKLLKGIGYGCDEEAIRVLKMAPNWEAGKQRGKPVRVYMSLPIVFKLME